MTFDVTIPVLNEEATLDRQVRILHEFLRLNFQYSTKWQIVIADNGSEDRTLAIAQQLAVEFQEVTFVKVPRNWVGLAFKSSCCQSEADIVGYMDLDLATDLMHFLEAYEAIAKHNYDIVYASRLHRESKVINRPFKREIASRIFNLLLQGYLRVKFSDGMCGFKFLKRSVYPSLYENGAQNDGWFFSTELLVVAEWLGLSVYELPVKWTDDISSSKVKIIPLAKRYIRSMINLKQKRPI